MLRRQQSWKDQRERKTDLKTSGLCFHILHLALKNTAVARHPWPALAVPAEDTAIASPLLSACYHALQGDCCLLRSSV